MFAINLLNWRSANVKIQRRRLFLIMMIVMFACACIGLMFNLFLERLLNKSKNALAYVNKEMTVNAGILVENAAILEHKKILQDKIQIMSTLGHSRALMVIIFDDLVRIIPADISLTGMELMDNVLSVNGASSLNDSVTMFIEKMQLLAWVSNAKLLELKDYESQVKFSIELTLNSDGLYSYDFLA